MASRKDPAADDIGPERNRGVAIMSAAHRPVELRLACPDAMIFAQGLDAVNPGLAGGNRRIRDVGYLSIV